MNTSPEIDKISAALVKSQAQFKAVGKASTNPHFKSKYASLDDILAMAVPVLNANGIALIQQLDGDQLGTLIMHESGQWIEGGMVKLHLDRQNMQGLGSAVTYARRYTLGAMLGIATEDDDDGNAASKPTVKPATVATSKPAAAKKAAPAYDETINEDCKKWEDWKTQKGTTLAEMKASDKMDAKGKVEILEKMKAQVKALAESADNEVKAKRLFEDVAFIEKGIAEISNEPF